MTGSVLSAKDWYERGYALKLSGDTGGALVAYRQSIKLNPRVAAPWIALAQLLEANNQLEESRQCLIHATSMEPTSVLAHRLLAHAHQTLGYVDAARDTFQHALQLDPLCVEALCGLGQLLEDLGDPQSAAASYRSALRLDDRQVEARARLLGLARHVDINGDLDAAKKQMESLPAKSRAVLGYGLGQAYEQINQYEAAFAAFEAANQARIEDVGAFNRARFDRRIDRMVELFSADFFAARQGWGNASEQSVFIVGLPRSGTTLTESILATHADCFGAGELNVLTDVATGAPQYLDNADDSWPECASQLSKENVQAMACAYLDRSADRAPNGVSRIVDKQPLNFWHLGFVALALPNAKVIHCQRDIRDCGLSIYTQNFNVTQSWSTNLDDIAHYWKGYRRLMDHFKCVTGLAIHDSSYEALVEDQERRSRELLEFVGLSWDAGVLNFHESGRTVQTPSRWQVRQPVYKTSKARWRRYKKQLGPLISAQESVIDEE